MAELAGEDLERGAAPRAQCADQLAPPAHLQLASRDLRVQARLRPARRVVVGQADEVAGLGFHRPFDLHLAPSGRELPPEAAGRGAVLALRTERSADRVER